MRLDRIDRDIALCKGHLGSTGSYGTEIEALLVVALLVIAYVDFEAFVNRAIQEKAEAMGAEVPPNLFRDDGIPGHRGMLTSQLAQLLEEMGVVHQSHFKAKTTGDQRAESFYNNIITNRHVVAHGSGPNVTLSEMERFYVEGHVVLDYFYESLFLSATEAPIA